MDRQVSKGTLTEEAKLCSIRQSYNPTTIAEGVKDAELVVEAATENMI